MSVSPDQSRKVKDRNRNQHVMLPSVLDVDFKAASAKSNEKNTCSGGKMRQIRRFIRKLETTRWWSVAGVRWQPSSPGHCATDSGSL
jgi:hypothetical protein